MAQIEIKVDGVIPMNLFARQPKRSNAEIMSFWVAKRRKIHSMSANILNKTRDFSLTKLASNDISPIGWRLTAKSGVCNEIVSWEKQKWGCQNTQAREE